MPHETPAFNPVLDEETAVAMSVLINNQIEALTMWKRKLKEPYLPPARYDIRYRTTPVYPMPTLATTLHIMKGDAAFKLEMLRLSTEFLHREKIKRDKA